MMLPFEKRRAGAPQCINCKATRLSHPRPSATVLTHHEVIESHTPDDPLLIELGHPSPLRMACITLNCLVSSWHA